MSDELNKYLYEFSQFIKNGGKYRDKYNFSSDELEVFQQRQTSAIYQEVIPLATARPPGNPYIINQPGRGFIAYGICIDLSGGTPYDPVLNTGYDAFQNYYDGSAGSTPTIFMAWARFNDPNGDPKMGIPVKHCQGYVGTFNKLILQWPTQISQGEHSTATHMRIVIFKWDGMPWNFSNAPF